MYIKNLEIDNFKSFANKTEIPFLEGFTTVAGPNGSGKSTIIDSILFVLGLASARDLRAENLSHFISTLTKRNEAFVKVTFAGLENGEELSVARKIRKTNQGYQSTYYLNDSVATLSAVHAVLEQHNVTPNSYNVIMQGDVTAITGCTPRERRKIIDEIAGVADFDRRINEATNKLEDVNSKVDKANVILVEVERVLEQLKEEREVAIKYNALKTEKQGLESQVTKVRFFDVKKKLEQAHQDIIEFTKKKRDEESKGKDLAEKLELLRKKYNEIAKEVSEKGEAEQLELKRKEEGFKGDINRKNDSINYAQKQIQENLKAITNANTAIENNKKNIAEFQLQITAKREEIKIIEENITLKENELKKINEDITGLSDSSSSQIEKLNKLRKNRETLKDEEYALMQEKLPKENELSNLEQNVAQYKNDLENLRRTKETFSSDYELKKELVEQLEKELQDFKNIQQNTREELETLKNEIADGEYKVDIASRKVSQMEAKKQFAEEHLGREIDTIMSANLRGVHAPLVQLGSVDKEYSTAMEVAFGGRITHIVVDDERVASNAIEILLSKGAGRATFIPLNKIKPAPTRLQLPKDSGVIDFAINLVDFDDMYLDAFYYAVGDTLVVENMECARKLIGKYRMVTLNGELFEKSGSITGGTLRKTGLSFSQNDDEELDKFKSKLNELQKTLASKRARKTELENKLDKIRSMYSDSSNEASKAKIELSNMKNNFENGQKLLTEKEEYIKNNEPKINELRKVLDKLEDKNVALFDKLVVLDEEISELEKLVDDTDLKELREKTRDVEADLKKLNTRKMQVLADIDLQERQIEFNNSVSQSKLSDIKNIEKNNEILKSDIVRYEGDIKVLNEKIAGLSEQLKEIEAKLGELLQQRNELHEALIAAERDKALKEDEIERIAGQIDSFKSRRKELEPLLEEAKNELEQAGVELEKLEPVNISIEEITNKIARLEKRMEDLGAVNMRALTTYDENLARQQELKNRIDTLTMECNEILEKMKGYELLKKEEFMKTFTNINENFKEMFKVLAEGEGRLVLENENDPLNGGLTIESQPRGKSLQRLEGLSGGEKAMTALAFVLAIQRYMPSPFYAFDEVDASLDTINVEHLADMVGEQAKKTQFVVVSHRKPMIERADRTIGVTQKEKGKTKVTGVTN